MFQGRIRRTKSFCVAHNRLLPPPHGIRISALQYCHVELRWRGKRKVAYQCVRALRPTCLHTACTCCRLDVVRKATGTQNLRLRSTLCFQHYQEILFLDSPILREILPFTVEVVLGNYLLTPWSRVLLEKLTGCQLAKKFLAFYGTRRIITVLTSAHHLSLSWDY